MKKLPTKFPVGFRVSTARIPISTNESNGSSTIPLHAHKLVLIKADNPCNVAAILSENKFRAAPVQVCESVLAGKGPIQSVLFNSGCANSCTGERGLEDAWHCVDEYHKLSGAWTLPLSSGPIGQHVPIQKLLSNLPDLHNTLESNSEAWSTAAEAFKASYEKSAKLCVVETEKLSNGHAFSILGLISASPYPRTSSVTDSEISSTDKESQPETPASLLCLLLTDAHLAQSTLSQALKRSFDKTFTRTILSSIDPSLQQSAGTNDSTIILSNTATTNQELSNQDLQLFQDTLESLMLNLGKLALKDHQQTDLPNSASSQRPPPNSSIFISVQTRNAPDAQSARMICQAICDRQFIDSIVLTGRTSGDYWSGLVSRIGSISGDFKSSRVSVAVGEGELEGSSSEYGEEEIGDLEDSDLLMLVEDGAPYQVDAAIAGKLMENPCLRIIVDLGCEQGFSDTMWTSSNANTVIYPHNTASTEK